MTNNYNNTLFFLPTSSFEIQEEINNSKLKYSNDCSDINMFLIKKISIEISPILSYLFNRVFSEGVFPNILKIAKVIPLFKKSDKSKPENYRPISLLPQFSKILEQLIKNRLLKFLDKFNIISKCQYGFRNKISTADALVDVIETVCQKLENLNKCAILSIDLRKAFDTLNHDTLFKKLYVYGIRGISLDLLKSYLSNRMQYVFNKDIKSNLKNIKCGVPQGSVLGPILFLLYINDLPNISSIFKPILFADDTTLIFSDTSISKLENKMQCGIDQLYVWLNINKLSLNIDKTNILLFNIRNINDNVKLKLKIDNKEIRNVEMIKFLGIIIDNKLDWNRQIHYVCTKLSRSIAILNKVKLKLNSKALVLLYNSFFDSHLYYCAHIW